MSLTKQVSGIHPIMIAARFAVEHGWRLSHSTNVAVVLSGANIDGATLACVLFGVI